MKMVCAKCGFEWIDSQRHVFDSWGHKRPDVYFCDTCITWGSYPTMRSR